MQNTDTTETASQIFKVVGANATAIGITISDFNEVLTTTSLVLAISYTIYKFVTDWRKK